MLMTLRTAALAGLLIAPALAVADEEHDDKLCEVIGEAPNISVPPKDRLWFKENCICAGAAGCGKQESKRFSQRLDAAAKALEAKKAAHEEAARKKKRREAEEARLRVSVRERTRAVESSDERFEICVKMAASTADPARFCHRLEAQFLDTPEGKALYEAEFARANKKIEAELAQEEVEAAARRAAEEKKREAELARQEAEERAAQLKRVRAACRAFHTCMELKRESCAADRWLFDQACRAAHFDGTTPASTSYSDQLCRNKTGPCD